VISLHFLSFIDIFVLPSPEELHLKGISPFFHSAALPSYTREDEKRSSSFSFSRACFDFERTAVKIKAHRVEARGFGAFPLSALSPDRDRPCFL